MYTNDGHLAPVQDSGVDSSLGGRSVGVLDYYADGLLDATGDVNRNGWTDLFVGGSNRHFTGGEAGFEEATADVFAWETYVRHKTW